MDSAAFLTQVFWLTLIFCTFYIIVTKNILPVLSRILKVRTKKLSQGEHLLLEMQNEETNVTQNYEVALSSNIKDSESLLRQIADNSSTWVEQEALQKTGKGASEQDTILMNSRYLEAIANLTSKKSLLLPILKGF